MPSTSRFPIQGVVLLEYDLQAIPDDTLAALRAKAEQTGFMREAKAFNGGKCCIM